MYLRSNLFTSLLNIYQSNLEKNSVSSKYFEINTVFDKGKHEKYENIPNQLYTLGVLTPSRVTNVDLRGEDKTFDIYYVKNLISTLIGEFNVKYLQKPGFHKRLSFLILKDGKQVGFFGQLSYELMDDLNLEDPIYLMELNIENIDSTFKETNNFIPLAQYPFIKFDLSFTVPIDFIASDLISFVVTKLDKNENNIDIFDDYVTEKSRNLGIRISTRNYDQTYSEEEARGILDMLVNEIQDKFKIKLNKSQ